MNRAVVNTPHHFRNKALVGAIVAALSLGAAGTAAADTTYSLDAGAQTLTLQNYLQMISTKQDLSGPVTSSISNSEAGYRGPAADGALTVSGNTVQAQTLDTTTHLLGANGADNSIDLGLLGTQDASLSPGDANQGIGIFSGQLATAGVSTQLSDDDIGLDLTDYTAGNATVTGNTLNSTTLVNGASNRATGALNTTPFSSTTAGTVSLGYTPAGADVAATGGVTIGNAQVASGVASSALVSGTDVSLVNVGPPSSAPVTVSDNTVTAADTGNRGDNRFSATAGAVSYAGSVGVVNGQVNIGGSTAATIESTDIGAELDGTYGGKLSVSNNSLSASAQGNDAAAVDANNNLVRGNAISFGQGINVTGVNDAASLALSTGNVDDVSGTATADLSLLNTQGNQQGTINGILTGSRIGAEVGGLSTGSLTATQDHASASAGGNSAINLVSANGSSFDASVAVGNEQANDRTDIHALATGITVGTVRAGFDTTGDVTVGSSSIAASANGSNAQTVVDLQGSNFNAAGTGAAFARGNATSLALDHTIASYRDPGVIVGNVQGNYGTDTEIGADVEDSTLGAQYLDAVTNSNATVDGNAIAATAGGNSASTSLAAAGATGALSALLDSGQYNENAITANATGNFLGIESLDTGEVGITGSALTVSNDSVNASASANQATNSLTTAFDSSLALPGGPGGSIVKTTGTGTIASQAALNLLNGQTNANADVVASVQGGLDPQDGQIGVLVDGSTVGSSVSVQGNAAGASAIGNSAGNTLAPTAGSLVLTGTGSLATLGNLQMMSGDSSATVGGIGIGYGFAGSATDLTGSVDNNALSALAGGNMAGGDGGAGNRLSASGTSLVDSANHDVYAKYTGGALSVQAAFTLQNAQSSTSGERHATIDGSHIGGAMGNAVLGSDQSVSNNGLSTDARDNYAANTLGLNFDSTLVSSGVLQSMQDSHASMTSAVTDAEVGLTATTISDSSLTVTGNDVSAKAIANTASNQFSVQASELSGTATSGPFRFLPGLAGVDADYRGAVIGGTTDMIVADYGLSNVQSRSGGNIAPSATGIQIGVSADTGGFVGSPTTVSGNTVTVLGQGNSAGNGLALSGSSIDASAAILNDQSISSAVTALANDVHIDINADTGITGGVSNTVSGNSVEVSAGLNDATNALSVNADNTVDGNVGLAGASNDTGSFDGFTGAVADFAVTNSQTSTSTATANLTNARAGVLVGDSGVQGAGGSLTVTDNHFDAQASGNNASNSVALNGAGSVGATAAVHSQQSNGGAIGTTVIGVDVSAGNRDTGTGSIGDQAVTLTGNRVSGSASGNSASNAISVSSAALNAGFVSTQGGSSDVSTAVADYALNNVQGNTAAISTTMSNVTIGSNLNGGVGSVLNSHAAIGSNMVMASASGNSASNSIMLASVAGISMPSAALTSSQVNSAGVSASINGASIGMIASGLTGTPVTVNNNTISASATGNSAVNHIGINN